MRINQLTSANILRFIAVVDPIEIGYKSWAMLGITVVPGVSPYDLALELSEHSEVTYATVVASKFDLLVEVWCLNNDKLVDFLEAHCYQPGNISSIETMVGLKLYKWLYPVPDILTS
jgi:Lrp/AsnC family transcriptional regulator for asnA, asnC and gidA